MSRGTVLTSHEFEEMKPPIGYSGHRCGGAQSSMRSGRNDHLAMWNGYLGCALYIDVEVPTDDFYEVEIVAWADRFRQYGENRFAELSVAADAHVYHEGDTWYRDMRVPGFFGEQAPNSDSSVQWLAKKIVADERFAEAAVKFWWPSIMASEVAEPPEDETDADFEGLLLAANAQGEEVTRLARGFRRGFRGGRAYNLKDLLVEIVLSNWFRADSLDDSDPIRQVALRDACASRLLTPEELARKTAALTGVQWGRHFRTDCRPPVQPPSQRAEQRVSASLWGHRFGRNYRTCARHDIRHGWRCKTTGSGGELSGRHAGFLPFARGRSAVVRGHRPVCGRRDSSLAQHSTSRPVGPSRRPSPWAAN